MGRLAPIFYRFAILLVLCGSLAAGGRQQESNSEHRQSVSPERALISQYCVSCHNDKTKTAGLALDTVSVENVKDNPEVWEKVLRKVRARYMPPSGLARPDEKTYSAFVSYLETSLDRVAAAKPNPGRSDTFRRLNRTEYQNAIRDLLGLDVDVTSLLPKDDSSHGFDNITVGELSLSLLERYLATAQKISRLAIGSPVRSVGGDTFLVAPDLTQDQHFDELPFGTRGGTVVDYAFPVDGEYEIQLRLFRDRNENVEGLTESAYTGVDADKLPPEILDIPHRLELTLDGERITLFDVKAPPQLVIDPRYKLGGGHDIIDKDFNVRIPIKAGRHVLGATFLKKPSALPETQNQPYQAHFNFYRHPRIQPALYSLSVLGPYSATGTADTPSRRRIFICRPVKPSEEESCAKRILSTLTRRAYRRPVTETDLQVFVDLYKQAAPEEGFEAGIEMALRALLVRPEFLFRVELDPANIAPNTAYRITDVDLASRLSFFLWSSIPDDELLDLAIRGKLQDPAVFEQQVRRMLADNRSQALINSFAEQWLYLRNLASTNPDPRSFPDFDDNLRQALRRETELFFESMMREDRNVLDLLRANYTFVNERLAKHYGIPNVYGSHFRRVTFGEDSVRGGLLGQGSILTVTSYGNRTSPVIRGKWILSNVLGMPPPPPPPNVPPLKENDTSGKILTVRERMAEHRANPACAGCHRLMDPVGFSLENYDAVGRWRNREGGVPIDVSGNLPDGSKFVGASGLKQALLGRPELFVTTLTEKLLTYGLGRGLESYDAAAVRKIVRDAASNDYRFSSIVLGITNSTPFRMRRSQ